jgi:hybrid cluster-associated redox disulfide protein
MLLEKKNRSAFDTSRGSSLAVDTVMRTWPGTLRAFLSFGMGCTGCPIGSFHTVEEACKEHGVALGGFLSALSETAAASQSEDDSAIK